MWKRCHLSFPDPFLHNQWDASGGKKSLPRRAESAPEGRLGTGEFPVSREGETAGGTGLVHTLHYRHVPEPTLPTFCVTEGSWAAIPKALSICYVLWMHQETTSPSAGPFEPGERTVSPISCAVTAPV